MVKMLPDRTFYPSAALAGEAPAETLAYVALLAAKSNGKTNGHTDAIGVVDVDPASPEYGQLVGKVETPTRTPASAVTPPTWWVSSYRMRGDKRRRCSRRCSTPPATTPWQARSHGSSTSGRACASCAVRGST
jgi:hypothetical protein